MAQATVGTGDAVSVYRTKFNANFDELYAGTNVFPAPTTLTAATGVITVTQRDHIVAAEGAGTTDDIITINGGASGQWALFTPDTGDTITFNDNSGTGTNIDLGGFATAILDATNETLAFRYDGTNWVLKWVSPNVIGSKTNTASYAANQTLTVEECFGYVIYVTGAATITLPAVQDGMSVTVVTIGAIAVSVDPNASDLIRLDGTALDDGDKITNTSTSGDIAVLTYYSADGWYASTNSWTDGGP